MTTSAGPSGPEPGLSALLRERRQLIDLGYRLLGSLSEAEDVVQETYARWYALPAERRDAIEVPGAWLTTVASRICLDVLRSARARRECYVGEWIPEPLPGPDGWGDGAMTDPADRVTLDESVTMAFLVVLESMTPAERVAFVLHDVFRYAFAEVAEIAGRSPAACRQLASSARRRLRAAQAPPPPAGRADVVRAFKRAWEAKDVRALVGVLDPDAVVVADGGGVVLAALEPVEGSERIARYVVDFAERSPVGITIEERLVNGQPGLVARQDGVVATVFAFEVAGDRVRRIWAVRNPAKLRPWTSG